MKIYYNLEKSENPKAIALGFFDGVHIAHQKIIEKAVDYSRKNLTPCVLTFSQNPRTIVENISLDLITTTEQKLEIMKNMGIQEAYVLDFKGLKDMLPVDFVNKIIHDALNAKAVFCGFNYRFGKFGAGDTDTLKRLCKNFGIEVFVEPAVLYEREPISSTRIRTALREKNFELANKMLANR